MKMASVTVKCLARALLMFVLLTIIASDVSLTVPRNLVALTGEKVELKCSVEENPSVVWGFTSYNTSKDADISFGENISLPLKSRYKIEKRVRGQHNIVIDSVDLDHAGKYRCLTIATGIKVVAYLTVLVSSPECSANGSNSTAGIMETDYLWMWCRIIYAGNMIPIFTWATTNAEDVITSENQTTLMTATSSVIRQLQSDDNGVVFKCSIAFQMPNNSEGNAPDYQYTWTYTASVLYGPRNLSIFRNQSRLVCSADGNPVPTYRWIDVETNRSVDEPFLIVDEALDSDKERNVECTAVNILGTQRKSFTLLINGSFSSHRVTIAASVGGGSFILLLVVIAVSCSVRSKQLKGITKNHASCFERSVWNEPDIIDVDIYAYDEVVFSREPTSEHEQNGSNALRVVENHGTVLESIPVYAEVKKGNGKEDRKRISGNCSSPASARVKTKKKANESLNGQSYAAFGLNEDHSQTHQLPNQKKKRQSIVGADGTEYLDLSEVKLASNVSTTRAATPPTFTSMNYAFIDHTARAPPPPPKL